MTKVATQNPFISAALSAKFPVEINGKTYFPMINPNDLTILGSTKGTSIEGVYLARTEEFCEQTGRKNDFRGNGYIFVSLSGELVLVPEWANLAEPMSKVEAGSIAIITVNDNVTTKNGDSYIKTSIMLGGKLTV